MTELWPTEQSSTLRPVVHGHGPPDQAEYPTTLTGNHIEINAFGLMSTPDLGVIQKPSHGPNQHAQSSKEIAAALGPVETLTTDLGQSRDQRPHIKQYIAHANKPKGMGRALTSHIRPQPT